MGNISHTVGGDANLTSFKSAARVPITSAKCEFLPIQEGEGTPSPENIRSIRGWNSVDLWQDKEYIQLPKEYQRVEYLQSTGTQYITLGRTVSTSECSFYFDVEPMTLAGSYSAGYNGIIGSNQKPQVGFFDGGWTVGNQSSTTPYKPQGGQRYKIIFSKDFDGKYYVDDIYTGLTRTGDIPLNIFYVESRTNNVKIRLYSAYAININNEYEFNLIPCTRKTDSKPGMYDTVSNTFYTNAGTGEFICGPDCRKTISVEFPAVGKNLLNKNKYSALTSNIIVFGGSISSGIPDSSFILNTGTYTLSLNTTAIIIVNNSVGNIITNDSNVSESTFTINSQQAIRILIYKTSNVEDTMLSYNYQLEVGNTATTYEPFNNTIYCGEIDIINGIIKRLGRKIILNGTENFQLWDSPSTVKTFSLKKSDYDSTASGNINVYMSYLEKSASYETTPWTFWVSALNNRLYITTPSTYTLDTFKAYLSEHPLEFVYSTSNTTSVVPQPLNTLLNQNYIWSNTNSNTTISYAIHESAPIRAAKHRIASNEPHIETASGAIANFKTDMTAPLKSAKIYFNPIQEGSGDPSPENVRGISGWTGLDITHCGKNLLNPNLQSVVSNNKTVKYSPIKLANGDYTFSTSEVMSDIYLKYNIYTYAVSNTNIFKKSSLPAGNYGVFFKSNTTANTLLNYQAEMGLQATAYEPYNGITIPLDWTSAAGTLYGGYIDLIKGELVQTYRKFVLTKTSHPAFVVIANNVSGKAPYITATPNSYPANDVLPDINNIVLLSDKLSSLNTVITDSTMYQINQYQIGFYLSNNLIRIMIGLPSEITDTTALENWFNDIGGINCIYKLATPITYQLTPQTLKSLRGINNIWSNSNGNIEVKYWTH